MTASPDLLKELRIDRRPGALKKKRRWPMYLAIAVVILGALWWLGGARPIEVETAKARSAAEGGAASVLDASGYVTARRIATVSSKITGKVSEVLIEEGQRVAEGEVLARLDADDADAQRDLAQAQVASSQSQLAEAQAQLKLAESNLVRTRELAAKQTGRHRLPRQRHRRARFARRPADQPAARGQRRAGSAEDRPARRRQHHHPRALRRRHRRPRPRSRAK